MQNSNWVVTLPYLQPMYICKRNGPLIYFLIVWRTIYGVTEIWVNIGLGNDELPCGIAGINAHLSSTQI